MPSNKQELIVTYLPPFAVKNHWDTISTLLAKADDDAFSIYDLDPEDLPSSYEFLAGLYDNKIVYILLCEKVGKMYYIQRIAGARQGYTEDPYPAIVLELVGKAKYLECNSVVFSGTEMWQDKLKSLGFNVVQYMYQYNLEVGEKNA